MNKIKFTFIIGIISVLCLAFTGCTTYNNFKEAFIDDPEEVAGTINIGVYEPLAGADKDLAKAELSGIELAHQLLPEADGRKINLVYADNNSDINAAETAISTLITKKPRVILGSYGNIYSMVAGEHVLDAQIPAISITNTNPLITENNSYYFRVCYIDATQGRLLARYLEQKGVDEAGILLPEQDDAAMAMATSFRYSMENLTDKDDVITVYEKYSTGDTDFTEQLTAIKESPVKYVLLPGEVTDAVNIIKQAQEMGLKATFLGDISWGDESFLKELGPGVDMDRLAFVQFFAPEGGNDKKAVSREREAFLKAYHQAYGDDSEPEEAAALGYDAYMLAVDAILKASDGSDEPVSGEAVRNVLLDSDYSFAGATGTIRFNKNGDPKKTAYISTWNEGVINAVYTIEASQQ